jgi:predicted transcriptional regulator
MDTAMDDLMAKVKAIAQGPDGELLIKIVDTLFDRVEEEFTREEWADIQARKEAVRRGEFVTLEDLRKELGL